MDEEIQFICDTYAYTKLGRTSTDGNECRLYFKDSQIICYIGPDKKVVDYPDGIDYGDFNGLSGELNGDDRIWTILAHTALM